MGYYLYVSLIYTFSDYSKKYEEEMKFSMHAVLTLYVYSANCVLVDSKR